MLYFQLTDFLFVLCFSLISLMLLSWMRFLSVRYTYFVPSGAVGLF